MSFLEKLFISNFEKQGLAFLNLLEKHGHQGLFLESDFNQLVVLRKFFVQTKAKVALQKPSLKRDEILAKHDLVDQWLVVLMNKHKAKLADKEFFDTIKALKA